MKGENIMLKKTVTCVDYNGVEYTDDYYFNLTKAEIMKMEMGVAGGLAEKLQKIIATNDAVKIMEFFEELVLKAYGEKSDDGKRFIKSPEISAAFSQTEAYSTIFMELALDAEKAAEFVNGIIPADLAKQLENNKLA